MSGDDTIRLGLVGAGRWGRNYISTIAHLDGVELVRLASRNPVSRKLVDPGCRISETWSDLIEAGDLDGLIVATGPAAQGKIAAAAIAAGLPLMLEKPVATDVAAVRSLNDLSKRGDVPVLVDHIYLFNTAFAVMKEQIRRLGGLRSLCASRGGWGPFRPDLRALWDWAPHDVAMCINLVGAAPEQIAARVIDADRTTESNGEVICLDLTFPSEVTARITVGNLMDRPARLLKAICQNGELIFDDLADNRLMCRSEAGETAVSVANDPPLNRAITTFARGIAGGDRSAFGLDLAVEVTHVIAKAERQLDSERTS